MVVTRSQAHKLQQAPQLAQETSDSSSNVEPELGPELSGALEQQLEEQVDLNIPPGSESRGPSVLSSEFRLVMMCLILIEM